MLRNPYKRYRLVLNNCYDSTSLRVVLSNSAQEDILVMHYNYSVGQDSYYARDEDSRKFSIDILDHTYYDVIEIPGNETHQDVALLARRA